MGNIKSKKVISASIVGLLTLTYVTGSVNLGTETIVNAASNDVLAVHNKIEHIRYSLSKNYLGLKNIPQWKTYIEEARKLNNKLSNGSSKDKYTKRINKVEDLVNAVASVNQVEKSMESNAHIMGNIPQWNKYVGLAKINLSKVDKEFNNQVDSLSKRIDDSIVKIETIESKYEENYKKVESLYSEGLDLWNTSKTEAILKLKEAEKEAKSLQTHSTKEEMIKKIQDKLEEYEKNAPKIEILGVNDNEVIDLKLKPEGVTPSVKGTYDNAELKKNGNIVSEYKLGQTVKEVGKYSLSVTKGNDSIKVIFEIKNTTESGNNEGGDYDGDSGNESKLIVKGPKNGDVIDLRKVNGAYITSDSDYDDLWIKKDGERYSGFDIKIGLLNQVGHYEFYMRKGSQVVNLKFEIIRSEEEKKILISGIKDGAVVDLENDKNGVTPTTTSQYDSVVLTKYGEKVEGYDLGSNIIEVGEYVLKVANSGTSVTISFTITKTEKNSKLEIIGVNNNQTIDLKDTPEGVSPKCNNKYDSVSLTKDGAEIEGYKLGEVLGEVGKYALVVSNGDVTETISFKIIDSNTIEPKEVLVVGGEVFDLADYPKGIILTNEANMPMLAKWGYSEALGKEAYLNASKYNKTPITSVGQYRLALAGQPGIPLLYFSIVDSRTDNKE